MYRAGKEDGVCGRDYLAICGQIIGDIHDMRNNSAIIYIRLFLIIWTLFFSQLSAEANNCVLTPCFYLLGNYSYQEVGEEDMSMCNSSLIKKNWPSVLGTFHRNKRVYLKTNYIGGKNILSQDMFPFSNATYIIRYEFFMESNVTIPKGCILQFEGGCISGGNNLLIGQNTSIKADETPILNDIIISGTWRVTNIYSSWFNDYARQDVIKNVFALQSNDIRNNIYLGNPNVSVSLDSPIALNLTSNTNLYMAGTINLVPTERENYRIINISNVNNVLIKGGNLVADYHTHLGEDGEFGHAIKIDGGSNVTIDGVTISGCWGDGISVDDEGLSKNVRILNCDISNCRRNGITIGNCEGFMIKYNSIYDIHGTEPQCCIQLENNGCVRRVSNGEIYGNVLTNFKALSALTKNSNIISDIKIANNIFTCKNRGVLIQGCENILVEDNSFLFDIYQNGTKGFMIAVESSENIKILDNNLYSGVSEKGQGIYVNTKTSVIKGNKGRNFTLETGAACVSTIVEENIMGNCTFGASGTIAKKNVIGPVILASGASIYNNVIQGEIVAGIGCNIVENEISIDIRTGLKPIVLNKNCFFKGNNVTLCGKVNAVSYIETRGGGVIEDNVFNDNYLSGSTTKFIQFVNGSNNKGKIQNNIVPASAVHSW